MELTFVHQYSGEAPKRRRLAKACESCRARKVCSAPRCLSLKVFVSLISGV